MGVKVALASRRIDQLESIVKAIEQKGGLAKAFPLDVTNIESVKACFDAISEWGTPSIVINNAGISVTKSLLGSMVSSDRSSTPHGGKQDQRIDYQYGIDIRRAPNQWSCPVCHFQSRRHSTD
jgi:NAD(P)-dependent dehydrogenase (short-subunit alcohol dehydrogenase family)